MYAIITLVYLIIAFLEIIPMYKTNQKKELWLYTVTIVFSFIISILLVAGIKPPSPADFIENIFKE